MTKMKLYSKAWFTQPFYSLNSAVVWLRVNVGIEVSVNGLKAAVCRDELRSIRMENLNADGTASDRFSVAIPRSELLAWEPVVVGPGPRTGDA